MSNDKELAFTTIHHKPRLAFKLSMNEYAIMDSVYQLSNDPKNCHPGWFYGSRSYLGNFIGISRQSVITICQGLEAKGFLIKQDETGFLKATSKWYDNFVLQKGCKESLQGVKQVDSSECKESLHLVKEVYDLPVKKVDSGCKESLHNIYIDNNSLDNNKNNISIDGLADKEELKPSKKESLTEQAKEVLEYLNHACRKSFKSTDSNIKHITGRLNEGFSVEELKLVVDSKAKHWLLDNSYNQYLRPSTLFAGKCDSYLQTAKEEQQRSGPQRVIVSNAVIQNQTREDFTKFSPTNLPDSWKNYSSLFQPDSE